MSGFWVRQHDVPLTRSWWRLNWNSGCTHCSLFPHERGWRQRAAGPQWSPDMFSDAEIKISRQKWPTEKGFTLTDGSRELRISLGGKAWHQATGMAAGTGSWETTPSPGSIKQRAKKEVVWCYNLPVVCFLQQGSTPNPPQIAPPMRDQVEVS